MLEPEDAMKWHTVHPAPGTYDFGPGDSLVKFAENHNMKVRGHTLVWANHNPTWLTEGNYSAQQMSDLLHEHITRVVGHFRGQVFAWDVVNEAFEERGKLRPSLWYDRPGIGAGKGTRYIEQAFRWAHEADPEALLFYNDAEAEEINRKSNAIYAMVKRFMRNGVPIDGVGFQMHFTHLKSKTDSIAANFARFAKLGVQIHITEMDVALPVDGDGNGVNPADLDRQAEVYRDIMAVCLKTRNCTAFQTWGFTDKYSWVGWATHKTKGAALLFDRQYRAKPAYDALRNALEAAAPR
jgi:endo-1,4-beta-xylanase